MICPVPALLFLVYDSDGPAFVFSPQLVKIWKRTSYLRVVFVVALPAQPATMDMLGCEDVFRIEHVVQIEIGLCFARDTFPRLWHRLSEIPPSIRFHVLLISIFTASFVLFHVLTLMLDS